MDDQIEQGRLNSPPYVIVSGAKNEESKSKQDRNNTPEEVSKATDETGIEREEKRAIPDKYKTLDEVIKAIDDVGIKKCDYTMSNMKQGQKTFGCRSLHSISDDKLNPYQECICYVGETLAGWDSDPDSITHAFGFGDDTVKDKSIFPLDTECICYVGETLAGWDCDPDSVTHAFGFGDMIVRDKSIFPLDTEKECHGFMEVLEAYAVKTPKVRLGGPTNFAPLIDKAIGIVKQEKKYHILVIIADGQVVNEQETIDAIVEASNYPLSIIIIGVGDGPWGMMKDFEDKLYGRTFDNFQFVDFHRVIDNAFNPQTQFSLVVFMEIHDQYKRIKKHFMLEKL